MTPKHLNVDQVGPLHASKGTQGGPTSSSGDPDGRSCLAWLLHAWLIKITFQDVAANKNQEQIDGQDDIGGEHNTRKKTRWTGGWVVSASYLLCVRVIA